MCLTRSGLNSMEGLTRDSKRLLSPFPISRRQSGKRFRDIKKVETCTSDKYFKDHERQSTPVCMCVCVRGQLKVGEGNVRDGG